MAHQLRIGDRVRAEWLEARPLGSHSIAGAQPKVAATARVVEGVVTHIRGNHPVAATSIGVWIVSDGGAEVVVDARHVVALSSPTQGE